jgi:energy-coupling factor transporter ATP-binding protein EcfA2
MPLRVTSLTPRGGKPVRLGKFNVLVGPNNSGKSQTLRDIHDFVISGSASRLKIFSEVALDIPNEADALTDVRCVEVPHPDQVQYQGVSSNLFDSHSLNCATSHIATLLANSSSQPYRSQLQASLGRYWIALLDAESRFKLAAPTESYDPRRESPRNALQAFYARREILQPDLRRAFKEAFGIDIALDWAALKNLYLRVGPDFGVIPEEQGKLDALMREAAELATQGDGYKSFSGVVLAMLTFSNRVLLLDEPEAFLHPAQARMLGHWLASYADQREAQVVVASHSADFLWGVVSAKAASTIVRLNRDGNRTGYHVAPTDTTREMVESPLLSSQPVLDSFFHRGVVLCEGDPDRAVYQTVAHRFLQEKGGESILFVHSNGKDALKNPAELLRNSGIPCCAILDIDALNSEAVLTDIVRSLTGEVPSAELLNLRSSVATHVEDISEDAMLSTLRAHVEQWQRNNVNDFRQARRLLFAVCRSASHWESVKRLGLGFFEGAALANIQRLLSLLKEIGIFVVPIGELESWLAPSVAKGRAWNRAALERLHSEACPPALKEFVGSAVDFLHLHRSEPAR